MNLLRPKSVNLIKGVGSVSVELVLANMELLVLLEGNVAEDTDENSEEVGDGGRPKLGGWIGRMVWSGVVKRMFSSFMSQGFNETQR